MSSLINFLNPKLKPAVESGAVCEYGYTVENLISKEAEELQRGFMCIIDCHPPVELVFDFPKAIDMKVIKLWPSIGTQRSTSFELHSRHDDNWERVAFVKDLERGVDSVTFCYQSDYNSQSSSKAAAAIGQPQSEKVFFFKTAHKFLANTNRVKVIIRATERCPPVLRKVQMWGLPARSLDKADREQVTSIWSEISDAFGQRAMVVENTGQPPQTVPELREQSLLCIPEEFLDSITWQMMTLPTVLPCGKVVDQSTIDKHAAEEAKWDRQPSDPFTGLEYNAERQAIMDHELKTRIEEFLMEHSGHFKLVPRSLGPRVPRLRYGTQFIDTIPEADTFSGLSWGVPVTSSTTSLTGGSPSRSPQAKRERLSQQESAAVSVTSSSTSITTSPSSSSLEHTNQLACFSHSLGSANCINCRSAQFRYELRTCRHLVCRDCLVQLLQNQVCVCKVSFCNSDVQRCQKLQ